jgi:hypothetical protein
MLLCIREVSSKVFTLICNGDVNPRIFFPASQVISDILLALSREQAIPETILLRGPQGATPSIHAGFGPVLAAQGGYFVTQRFL